MILNLQHKNKHKMKRALQILKNKGIINGEPTFRAGRQHLLPLKNKI